MLDKLILKQIMKKGRTTSEFATTAIGGVIAALVAMFGLPDLSPEVITEVGSNVAEGVGVVKSTVTGNGSVMDGLIRIVALIMGGNIASNYVKSRGESKAASVFAAFEAYKKAEADKESAPKVEGPENESSS